jgi:hypothetical protein
MEQGWQASLGRLRLNWWHVSDELLNIVANAYECGDTLPKPKKRSSQFGRHNASRNTLLFFRASNGTYKYYYPFKPQQGKTRENEEGCHYIQMGPHTNPITCPNFGASELVQNEYYL